VAITFEWDNPEKTCIRYEFQSWWSWQDLRRVVNEVSETISVVEGPVDVIVNPGLSAQLSETGLLLDYKDTGVANTDQIRSVVVVGNCSLTNLLFFMFRQIYTQGSSFHIADSLDKARQMIDQQAHLT
jgi:hypothetical protein